MFYISSFQPLNFARYLVRCRGMSWLVFWRSFAGHFEGIAGFPFEAAATFCPDWRWQHNHKSVCWNLLLWQKFGDTLYILVYICNWYWWTWWVPWKTVWLNWNHWQVLLKTPVFGSELNILKLRFEIAESNGMKILIDFICIFDDHWEDFARSWMVHESPEQKFVSLCPFHTNLTPSHRGLFPPVSEFRIRNSGSRSVLCSSFSMAVSICDGRVGQALTQFVKGLSVILKEQVVSIRSGWNVLHPTQPQFSRSSTFLAAHFQTKENVTPMDRSNSNLSIFSVKLIFPMRHQFLALNWTH